MTYPVVWFEVLGKDGDALQRYYAELFSWKINADNPMGYGMVEASGKGGIPGGIAKKDDGQKHNVTFYVGTKDIDATLGRAEKLGGKTLMPKTKLPEVTLAMFADPQGNVIGLVEQ